MSRPKNRITGGEDLFVGIDLHKNRWHVTIRTLDVELFSASIPGDWEALHGVLARYAGHKMVAIYEAGYFGFRLHRLPGESWHPLSGYSSETGPPGIGRVKTGEQQKGTSPSFTLRLEVVGQTSQNHELVQL
jgi:hypothetical protein